MNMNKDALEGMATILRENGYEVSFKETNNESTPKKPYICNKFNKIRDLDLHDLAYDTCMFLKRNVVDDFEMHDYIAGSCNVTIGYIEYYYDEDDEEGGYILKTNKTDVADDSIVEKLSNYDYVIKLSDVFKLMADNEAFGD